MIILYMLLPSINSKNAIPNPDTTHYFIAYFVSKYVGLRRGSLDNVFDYEKGEVNCQNEIVRNPYYWLRAMCTDEKRFEKKANCSTVTVTCYI